MTREERDFLRERFGLAVRPVVALESFSARFETPPSPPKPPQGPAPSLRTLERVPRRGVTHDGLHTNPSGSSHLRTYVPATRTHAEACVALKDAPEELAEPWEALYGRFSRLDVTSGLPDDSRDADERAAARQLRDLRGRVKAARAVIVATSGLAETLASDSRKAELFEARYGVTRVQLRGGVPNEIGARPNLDKDELASWLGGIPAE